MGGPIQLNTGLNGLGTTGGAGAPDFQGVAQTLGVDEQALRGAVGAAEQEAAAEIQALAADGDYSAADRQQVEAKLIDRVTQQLGLTNLSNEQMMALAQLCRDCLKGIENQVLGQNGVQSEQSLFSPVAGAGGSGGAGSGFLGGNGAFRSGTGNPLDNPLLSGYFNPSVAAAVASL